ncbi:hypothetical protein [Microbacterium sp. BK668]|uniref:hypothetical protein n=1 Tax=Microbacterium sp. BK668 TaxID=2512118 RepID=UPI0010E9349D|nr:hypothetical protein [Microbacterium sp. BK668]TDN92019.1 hypothetical protein EV279_1529 [Microbacterium sp. BK668]
MFTPDFEATTRNDSLGVDEEDLDAPESDDSGTLADGALGTDSPAVSDSSIADDDADAGTADSEGADATDPDIIANDPDEYSGEPHMGSVPRVLGEEEYMPDTQGEDPLYAELGDEGQGDLAPEDM